MHPTQEEQITAFLVNKPGKLSELCVKFTDCSVNIRAVSVLETKDISTIRMVVDNLDCAQEALTNAGAAFHLNSVLGVPLPNRPGAFGEAAAKFAEAGVNIEYVYASAMSGMDYSLAIFRVEEDQLKQAMKIEFDIELGQTAGA